MSSRSFATSCVRTRIVCRRARLTRAAARQDTTSTSISASLQLVCFCSHVCLTAQTSHNTVPTQVVVNRTDPDRPTHLLYTDDSGIFRVMLTDDNVTSSAQSNPEQVLPVKKAVSLDYNYERDELCYVSRITAGLLYSALVFRGLRHVILFLFPIVFAAEKQFNAVLQHAQLFTVRTTRLHFLSQTCVILLVFDRALYCTVLLWSLFSHSYRFAFFRRRVHGVRLAFAQLVLH